jgi:hypothetical protein
MIQNKDFIHFMNISTAYSELYADVVAAYNSNSKSTMVDALYFDKMTNPEFYMIQTRSFDTLFDKRHNLYMTEAHGYFASTRAFIGKNLWPKNLQDKQEFLRIIGDAIIHELRDLLSGNKEIPPFLVANRSLIERLKNH